MGAVWRLTLGITVLASLWIPSGADAQNASALVLEKSGATTPEVQPYSEIAVGATLSLPPRTRLVFLHYQTCRTVTVVGGKVAFEAYTYTITGGSKEEVRTPCPPTVRLRGQGEVAGTLMRSIVPGVRLSTSPTFVLVGDRADDFAAVRVSQAGATLLEAPLAGRGFRWPTGAAPLASNADYELVLVPKAEGRPQITVKFRAEGEAATAAGAQLTLISVD
jgi:hypothetical protein